MKTSQEKKNNVHVELNSKTASSHLLVRKLLVSSILGLLWVHNNMGHLVTP